MPQVMRCPHCSKLIRIPDSAAGKHIRCPACKESLLAKQLSQEPAVLAVSAAVPTHALPPVEERTLPAKASAGPSVTSATTVCPACNTKLLPGAVACMDCGYLLQTEPDNLRLESGTSSERPPLLCANPACGVANPPDERVCQRCGSPLPAPPGTVLHGRY